MREINLHTLADDAKLNRLHYVVLFWCAIVIIFDGYDLALSGIALPSIMKAMGVDATKVGVMVSSALIGIMFGNILFGTVTDRIGRRWTTAICLTTFSIFTAAAGFASSPMEFSVVRFIAGVGIGGVMPNVIAQMTEYSPRRVRSTMVTLAFIGYSVGGILAAALGKGMLERYGWPSVFVAAGVPVLLVPLLLAWMPESMAYLIKRGDTQKLSVIARRLAPGYQPRADDRFVMRSEDRTVSAPIRHLFSGGRGFSTIMFWIANFMCLFMAYALSSWLTKLMASAGYSLGSALTFVLVLNFGAVIGAVGGGWLADKFHIKTVLVFMFLLAAVSISLLGYKMPIGFLFMLVGLAGASTIGTQIIIFAYTGQYYPMAVRSTGIGWALGVGRTGGILAPILIGMLVGLGLPLKQNFMTIGLPAVVAAIAVALINHLRSASHHPEHVTSGDPQRATQ